MDDLKRYTDRVPARYRALYLKALRGKLAPRSAIKAKCLECVCWQRMEGGKDSIGDCAVRSCPLWSLRPFQASKRRSKASAAEVSPEAA